MKTAFLVAASIMAAGVCWKTAAAIEETNLSQSATISPTDGLTLSLYSHRRTPNLYWQIDANGRGEVSTSAAIGYEVAQPLIVSPAYQIAAGVHRFDIGKAGYEALRAHLGQIIDGSIDPYAMTDDQCALRKFTDSGSVELDWYGSTKGQLHLAHECLNGSGRYFHDRMVLAWHKLADLLHAERHPFVTIEAEPAKPVPATLRMSKKDIWVAVTTDWQIGKDGRGWVEFSKEGDLPTLNLGEANFVKAGRYHFRLDDNFHQSVLRELDPYLSGSKKIGSCEDEITTSDQPMVRIEWKDKGGKSASFASDMGCPSFATRFRKVELAFAELVRNGSIGASRIVREKSRNRSQ